MALNIVPITDLQQKTRKYVEQVRKTGQPIVVTQRGRPAAVLSAAEEYDGYLVTRDEQSYADWRRRLGRAERESRSRQGIELEAFLKRKRKKRRGG